jgi:outer membrane protein TolC
MRPFAVVLFALISIVFVAGRGGAQPAIIAPAPSVSVKVNEDPPGPVGKPAKTMSGWTALWGELPKNTADLRIALAEIERAEAATRIAWGAVQPNINGNVTLTYSSRPTLQAGQLTSGATLAAQLSATQVLINLRAFHQIGTQHVVEEIANLDALEVRRRLGLQLARSAASIAAASRLAEGNRTSLLLAIDRLVLTRKRLAAGVGDARDLVCAQQDVATARAVIAPADESLLQSEEALAIIIGTISRASRKSSRPSAATSPPTTKSDSTSPSPRSGSSSPSATSTTSRSSSSPH